MTITARASAGKAFCRISSISDGGPTAPYPIPPHKGEEAAWGLVMAFVVSPPP
jgi:hypothetical protein